MDFIHLDLEIVFQPEVMCKAVAEQTWYLVHKEHNVVEIPELKIHLVECNRSKSTKLNKWQKVVPIMEICSIIKSY